MPALQDNDVIFT